MTNFNLQDRTLLLARNVRNLVKLLPRTMANMEDAKQLIRSSGSIGANYIEANESLGTKDFFMRMKIARKEAKETHYWLQLLEIESDSPSNLLRKNLIQESKELVLIFSAIVRKNELAAKN